MTFIINNNIGVLTEHTGKCQPESNPSSYFEIISHHL